MSLTQEEKRIKIAEACGWRWMENPTTGIGGYWETGDIGTPNYQRGDWGSRELAVGLPDYFNDLNAMHEAEKMLLTGRAIEFVKQLSRILGVDENSISAWELHCTQSYDRKCYAVFSFTHATDKQRAEAFGMTLSLWT